MDTLGDERQSLKSDHGQDDSTAPLTNTDDSMLDDSKVKFLNGGKDSSVVNLDAEISSEVSFSGLGKDELMKYAKDPFWVRVRIILFVLFWVCWVGMLVAAIVIIVLAPRCPERKDMKWYEKDIIYQIYPKSFKDNTESNTEPGAGYGDLGGIAQKVGYLESIGVNAFWINAIYQTENVADENDIKDHKAINEIFGTRSAFEALRKTTKKRGMKMLLDFIPNHTGKKHDWFIKSQARERGYEDFYIWAGGPDNTTMPNNWVNRFGQPAWTFDRMRQQFYYHSSLSQYPELNLRNDKVKAHLDGILRFWLNIGVDGFVIKDLEYLFENNVTSSDETIAGMFTVNHMENFEMVTRWRNILNEFSDKPGRERVLIGQLKSSDQNTTRKYYDAGIQIVPTKTLVDLDANSCDVDCIKGKLEEADQLDRWTGWMLDNDETSRYASRVDSSLHKVFQVMNLLLPGTGFVYYGDEIAMTNGMITTPVDPMATVGMGRDIYRTPMLWTGGANAGFCDESINPWLPINNNYMNSNVEYNTAHFVGYTIFESFKDLAALRTKESFMFGSLTVETVRQQTISFTRKAPGFPGYLVIMNMVDGAFAVNLGHIADSMTLVYHSAEKLESSQTFNTKTTPVGFKNKGEIYVFEF